MISFIGSKTENQVFNLIRPKIEEQNIELWDIRYEKEGAYYYLRIYIDKDNGIDIDDCENATRPINKILDEHDIITEAYILEVGSVGLERQLNRPWHFEICTGMPVKVRLIRKQDDIKEIRGILTSADKISITLKINDEFKVLNTADIAKINLDDFND